MELAEAATAAAGSHRAYTLLIKRAHVVVRGHYTDHGIGVAAGSV